jgi:hypothetical protein
MAREQILRGLTRHNTIRNRIGVLDVRIAALARVR